MAPKKIRCTFKVAGQSEPACKEAAQRMFGDCGFCSGHYCAKHRLPEDHKCSGLEDVSILSSQDDVSDLFAGVPWWAVGLDEVLSESDDESLANFLSNPYSAGKSPTTEMLLSSSPSERK
ncbi:hypothetical protein PG994_011148 [Apiospora phragmitis]|uniref:AN1-type domain-containing protein n=1 Tax=Apiospora phragmitis TaxID=2905665 RepID=A0ABR1TS63_9PEZI